MFNVLDRITELRKERGWSQYRLAVNAGIPKSSLFTWYAKNAAPPIESLEKICNAYGISLAEFFEEKKMELGMTSLEKLRSEAGMTLQDLSNKSSVPVEIISAFEQRKLDIKGASFNSVAKIAKALGCSLESVVGD